MTKLMKTLKKKQDLLRKISDKMIMRQQKNKKYPIHCGPIALYNLLVKIKKPIRFSILNKLCCISDKGGTHYINFTNAVNYINKTKHINILEIKPKKDNIINIINNGGYVIILYHYFKLNKKNEKIDKAHYILIDNIKKNNNYKIINPDSWENENIFDFFLIKYKTKTKCKCKFTNGYFEYPKVWALL